MKIFLNFSNSIYDCDVIVEDSQGRRNYYAELANAKEDNSTLIEIDVADGNFDLTLIPQMPNYKSALSEMEIESWKDKIAKKAANALLSAVDQMFLRVGCKYRVSGVQENETIFLYSQEYVFGTFDRFELLELIPMAYMFFEAYAGGCRLEIFDAFGMNRKEVISYSRKITLLNFGLHLIVTYPTQVGRVKRLTSNKKIGKTLKRFSRINDEQRHEVLERQEKFLS